MSHHELCVAAMEYPTKGFGECVRWVDNARHVEEINVTNGAPMLESEIADVHVAGAISEQRYDCLYVRVQ